MRLATAVGLVVLIAVAALLWLRRASPVRSAPAAQPDPSQRDAPATSGTSAPGAGGSKAVAKADLPTAPPAGQPVRTEPGADAEQQRRALEQEKLAGLSAAGHDPPGN